MVGGLKFDKVKVSAPGKVILHGEHAVVFGKTAIAASLGLRSSVVIEENGNPNLILKLVLPSVNVQETFQIQHIADTLFKPNLAVESWKHPSKINHESHLNKIEQFIDKYKPQCRTLKSNQCNALKGILYLFSGILGSSDIDLHSMDLCIDSQLTVGAGTGSSASFAVIISAALIRLLKLKTDKCEGSEFSAEEKEIICNWAFNCERIMHGTPSGIDNATCTYGSVVSFRKGESPQSLDISLSVRVLLVDTRVARETRVLTARVAALRTRNMAAVDHVMRAIDDVTHTAVQVLEELSKQREDADNLTHYEHLAELWTMNHRLLGSLGVSHPALERVCAAAAEHGLAGKLTGAGGGGYAIILIPPHTEESTVKSLTKRLEEEEFRVTETKLGGAGVSIDM